MLLRPALHMHARLLLRPAGDAPRRQRCLKITHFLLLEAEIQAARPTCSCALACQRVAEGAAKRMLLCARSVSGEGRPGSVAGPLEMPVHFLV